MVNSPPGTITISAPSTGAMMVLGNESESIIDLISQGLANFLLLEVTPGSCGGKCPCRDGIKGRIADTFNLQDYIAEGNHELEIFLTGC